MFTYSYKTYQPIGPDATAEALENLYRDLSTYNKEAVLIRRISMTRNDRSELTTISITFN